MLQKQVVPVPFAQGISTKIDPKQVPVGKLLTLENGFFQTPGEIRKRYGYNAFSRTVFENATVPSTLQAATGLMSYADQLLMSSPSNTSGINSGIKLGRSLLSYDKGNDKWKSVGYFQPAQLTTSPVITSDPLNTPNYDQTYQDMAYDPTTQIQCFSYISGSTGTFLYTVFIDKRTGNRISAQSVTVSGLKYVKPTFFGGYFLVFYADSSGNIKYIKYDPANVTLNVSTVTPITDANTTNPKFDLSVISTRLFIAYNYTTTGFSIQYFDSSLTASSAVHNTSHAATGAIAIAGDTSNRVGVTYSDNTNVYAVVYDFSLSSTPMALATLEARANVNQIGLVYGAQGFSANASFIALYSAYTNHSITNKIYNSYFNVTDGVVIAGTLTQQTCSLRSKPFLYNSNIYFMGLYGGATTGQPTLFLFILPFSQGDKCTVAGKIAASIAYDSTRFLMPEIITEISGIYSFAFTQNAGVNEVPVWGSTWSANLDLTVLPYSAEIANTLHITGAQLWLYDGQSVTEHGFHLYPDGLTATPIGSGGALSASSSYQWIAVHEWLDAQGNLHRSAPSLPLTYTTGGTPPAEVDLVSPGLSVTNKFGVQTYWYRTAGNGTIFYFLGVGGTFADNYSDASIIGNVQLYTTGAQVENTSAPACSAIATYKSRLIIVPSDNPYSWWFSQEVIPNSASSVATPVEFSEFLVQNIDQKGGPITAVSSLDDKLVLFKKDLPFFVVGNGPSPNGANNDFSSPQSVTSAQVGALSQASIVSGPTGIMYQGPNGAGIWHLDRALTSTYIGSEVEAYNSQTVTSGVVYPQYNQIRFTMSGGVVLVYDYYVRNWSVYTGISGVQACLFQGQYTWVKADGTVYQESASTFTDNGTFVQLKVGTSWLAFAGVQGFQRVYEALILGEYKSTHVLHTDAYYDFNDTVQQSASITPTSTQPYQFRLQLNRQKCDSLRLVIYDTEASPAEALSLSGISLIVGAKTGQNKMAPSRTFT